ncbi:thioredoxin [Bizionia argentinensis JUB59]|uniref:Thioredoxin n=1 Tax=Bizionia argentinensis JUB59 TaxID=1046627 RepID=G2E9R1_9FLAO|nr:thioredoxin family protein [Bizionia argentinensis]EGV44940.1 thioredoxin [Bizionia argentinensis JUB59]
MNYKLAFVVLFYFVLIQSCKTAGNKVVNTEESEAEFIETEIAECASCDLIGEISRAELVNNSTFNQWFSTNYEAYQFNALAMETLKSVSTENISFKIILGTWCSDSHRDVPRFTKILDAINIQENVIEYYALDVNKLSPEGIENTYNIIQVPTFIVYKNGVELNRIVEMSVRTLEEDLATILTTNDYKNVYAD